MKHQVYPKPELLAPAGNFEKLEIAVHFGADAVYLAGKDFSLRNFSGNFTIDEMQQAIAFAHANKVKVYVACNIFPRNQEQAAIAEFLTSIGNMDPDGIIISDPGILAMARERLPQTPIHLSTQANTTNYNAARFWESQGIRRVNVARELTLQEIETIAERTTLEVEAFVHGAMCMAYSGRCLLSSFMALRDSNRGMCCHPCRFQYAVVEAKRPGQYYELSEDTRGTYIFNSRDLCMIEHLPEMIAAGISSLKIEGRMKGINYLASVVRIYRQAIDAYDPHAHTCHVQPEWIAELAKVTHREYCTGFYLGDPEQVSSNIDGRIRTGLLFLAKVLKTNGNGQMVVDVRNRLCRNDNIEIISAGGPVRTGTILKIVNQDRQEVDVVNPGSRAEITLENDASPNDIIRKVTS
jgi:U32 family peptidase